MYRGDNWFDWNLEKRAGEGGARWAWVSEFVRLPVGPRRPPDLLQLVGVHMHSRGPAIYPSTAASTESARPGRHELRHVAAEPTPSLHIRINPRAIS